MPIERIAVNASPLIVLFRSGQADLLPRLFRVILVPETVWQEVTAEGHNDAAAVGLPTARWAKRTPVDISPRIAPWNLGAGESAVLTLALDHEGCRALVDDRAARRCAGTLDIRTLGTGGMLVLAKRRGVIRSVADRLRVIRDAGLWISDELAELLLSEAGE